FEDINLGADGGLYAELVKNRSFEFSVPMMGWKEQKTSNAAGSAIIQNRGAQNPANPRYLRITHKGLEGRYGIANEGFRGMGVKSGVSYDFSVWAKNAGYDGIPDITLELQGADGSILGSAKLSVPEKIWKKLRVSFICNSTDPKARLVIWLNNKSAVDMDMISLFPQDTWKNRPGGMRRDLVQLLADMKPGFLRFPGGCIVEGRELATRYQWKKTIGEIENREMIVNRWNTEFAHRPTPDYFQTFGLGFYEYFQIAEDIGAEPLPILNCGMACQFNSGEVIPLDQLEPFIQDALDLIEFANGSVETKWGKLRAELGHPAPFNMKLLGVGNEQWGEQYAERHAIFTKAIKDKHPEIRLVSSVGPSPDGELFDYLSDIMSARKAEIVDEHYYRNPEWFLRNAGRYDAYPRSGPRIFAGEYAAQSVAVVSPDNKNNWRCAISEAAFMTGLERNADLVHMASYAPLFAHTDGWQWTPNLIWFDNLRAYGTPNYYVQKLYATNRGTHVLPVTYQGVAPVGQDGLYASATCDEKSGEVIVKIVNTTPANKEAEIILNGLKRNESNGLAFTLMSNNPEAVNSLDQPMAVSPTETPVQIKNKKLTMTLPSGSFSVVRVKN
ncbi:MAG: hypothetical protein RLZ62_1629, partial [Bacteroidota bacterium]